MKKKAVFLAQDNNTKLAEVYDQQAMGRLNELVELNPNYVNEGNVEQFRESLKDVEIAFTTWGMPKFTEEQVKQYFPNFHNID